MCIKCKFISVLKAMKVNKIYYNALNAYVTSTGAIFTPLCTSITTLETNTDDLSLKLMNLKPVI